MSNEMNNNHVGKSDAAEQKRYALDFSLGSTRAFVGYYGKYAIGTGDFTAEAWVCTNRGGTVMSNKATEGGYRNGGFLLVIKSDGVIKFATDDGFGFYEINTVDTNVLDGSWHHILATRKGDEMYIYLDFKAVLAYPRTNRIPNLNIDSNSPLVFGATDQVQEPYNRFIGKIGEIRFWNSSKTYEDSEEWAATDRHSEHLCGCWPFLNSKISDFANGNDMLIGGIRTLIEYPANTVIAGNTAKVIMSLMNIMKKGKVHI